MHSSHNLAIIPTDPAAHPRTSNRMYMRLLKREIIGHCCWPFNKNVLQMFHVHDVHFEEAMVMRKLKLRLVAIQYIYLRTTV